MKRYHDEKHIIASRAKKHRQINVNWSGVIDAGQFRKSMRCGGCGRARCQLCHPEKYPKRIPTRQEQQAKQDLKQEE